ncbi:MAG: aquaporin [Ilumatobacteraceae bacterium]
MNDHHLATATETGTGALAWTCPADCFAEALGTALLIVAVVGSGIMATNLSSDVGLQLPGELHRHRRSSSAGSHVRSVCETIQPAVTLVDRLFGSLTTTELVAYTGAQIVGGCLGTMAANLMFELPVVELSTRSRSSGALWFSEVLATFGLLLVIHGCVRNGRERAVPVAVGAWIGGAYWFTSSTSFANPAVTIARTLSDSFAGIEPASAPMFIVMQVLGAGIAFFVIRFLFPEEPS